MDKEGFVYRSVKIPVRINENDKNLFLFKNMYLNKMMEEARRLGNTVIRYTIAYLLKVVPKEFDRKTGEEISDSSFTYKKVVNKCKYLDIHTFSTLLNNTVSDVKKSDEAAKNGQRNLPTYKKLFIPLRKDGLKLIETTDSNKPQFIIEPPDGRYLISNELLKEYKGSYKFDDRNRKLSFISRFSHKDQRSIEIVRKIISGDYLLCNSEIIKIDSVYFVLLSFKFKPVPLILDPGKICGIDLGHKNPAVCATNFDNKRIFLGDGKDVDAARAKFRAERIRKQRRQGLYSKTKAWEHSKKEHNWIHTYYHALTRQVIKFCQQNGCGTINIEDLETLRQKDMKSEYKRRIWVPSTFYNLLIYKAEEIGIEVVKIDPKNTSQQCSKCGYISSENRKSQSEFYCIKCSYKTNADYNAARNIALKTKEV
jgi:IS605 OrfB family transposase